MQLVYPQEVGAANSSDQRPATLHYYTLPRTDCSGYTGMFPSSRYANVRTSHAVSHSNPNRVYNGPTIRELFEAKLQEAATATTASNHYPINLTSNSNDTVTAASIQSAAVATTAPSNPSQNQAAALHWKVPYHTNDRAVRMVIPSTPNASVSFFDPSFPLVSVPFDALYSKSAPSQQVLKRKFHIDGRGKVMGFQLQVGESRRAVDKLALELCLNDVSAVRYDDPTGAFFNRVEDIPVLIEKRFDNIMVSVPAKAGVSTTKKCTVTGQALPIQNTLLQGADGWIAKIQQTMKDEFGIDMDQPNGGSCNKRSIRAMGPAAGTASDSSADANAAATTTTTAPKRTRIKIPTSIFPYEAVLKFITFLQNGGMKQVELIDADLMMDFACFPTERVITLAPEGFHHIAEQKSFYLFSVRENEYSVKVYAKEKWMWQCGYTKRDMSDMLIECIQNSDPAMATAQQNPNKLKNGYTRLELRFHPGHCTKSLDAMLAECKQLLLGCNCTPTAYSWKQHASALHHTIAALDCNTGEWAVMRWMNKISGQGNGVVGNAPQEKKFINSKSHRKEPVPCPQKSWDKMMQAVMYCGLATPGTIVLFRDVQPPTKLRKTIKRTVVAVRMAYQRVIGLSGWNRTMTWGGRSSMPKPNEMNPAMNRDFTVVGMLPQTPIDLTLARMKTDREIDLELKQITMQPALDVFAIYEQRLKDQMNVRAARAAAAKRKRKVATISDSDINDSKSSTMNSMAIDPSITSQSTNVPNSRSIYNGRRRARGGQTQPVSASPGITMKQYLESAFDRLRREGNDIQSFPNPKSMLSLPLGELIPVMAVTYRKNKKLMKMIVVLKVTTGNDPIAAATADAASSVTVQQTPTAFYATADIEQQINSGAASASSSTTIQPFIMVKRTGHQWVGGKTKQAKMELIIQANSNDSSVAATDRISNNFNNMDIIVEATPADSSANGSVIPLTKRSRTSV